MIVLIIPIYGQKEPPGSKTCFYPKDAQQIYKVLNELNTKKILLATNIKFLTIISDKKKNKSTIYHYFINRLYFTLSIDIIFYLFNYFFFSSYIHSCIKSTNQVTLSRKYQ